MKKRKRNRQKYTWDGMTHEGRRQGDREDQPGEAIKQIGILQTGRNVGLWKPGSRQGYFPVIPRGNLWWLLDKSTCVQLRCL